MGIDEAFVDENGVYERCGACYGTGAIPVNELIQKLRCYACYSKDGKMSEECVVPKSLLADAADKLEEISKLCSFVNVTLKVTVSVGAKSQPEAKDDVSARIARIESMRPKRVVPGRLV